MKKISKLNNVVRGINCTKKINPTELNYLKDWLIINRNIAVRENDFRLIELVEKVFESEFIDYETQKELITLIRNFSEDYLKEVDELLELKEYIDELLIDGVINKESVQSIETWSFINLPECHGELTTDELGEKLSKLLETEDEVEIELYQDDVREYTNGLIEKIKIEDKLERLKKKVRNKEKIGIDLIDVLDSEEIITEIHNRAEGVLQNTLRSYSGTLVTDPEIVFISLVIIAIFNYDEGNFYDGVNDTYESLYDEFSPQKIEGTIRSILSRYSNESSNSRKINVALENAIVPKKYLPDFFDFIFDIYTINLDYKIPDDSAELNEELEFAYVGLRKNIKSDDKDIELSVANKTYKLIKTTRNLILNDEKIQSVIDLSAIVIRLIDKRVWGKNITIKNPYLKYGFEKWNKNFGNRYVSDKKEWMSRWKPVFKLKRNHVYLVPPIHKVQESYNYKDIKIRVFNGQQVINEIKCPEIRKIIGGYKINVMDIALECPLGRVKYQILEDEYIIYDSREELYRNFIVFNSDFNELKNYSDYNGTVIVCCSNGALDDEIGYASSDYVLIQKTVNNASMLSIGKENFYFSSLETPGLFGEKSKDCIVYDLHKNIGIPVYNKVDRVVFDCRIDEVPKKIKINQRSYNFSELEHGNVKYNGKNRCWIELGDLKPDIYCVKISNVGSFNFVLDPGFEIEEQQIDHVYMVSLYTSLMEKSITKEFNIAEFDPLETFKLNYKGCEYAYVVNFDLKLIKIDNNDWKLMDSDYIWIDDIDFDSVITLYGLHWDFFNVFSDKEEQLCEDQKLKRVNDCDFICKGNIDFIKSYIKYPFVSIKFKQNEEYVDGVCCYNKCVLNEQATEIEIDYENGIMYVKPVYYGFGDVHIEIESDDECIYKSDKVISGELLEVKELKSFTSYTIIFKQIERQLCFTSERIMKQEKNITFYAFEDFVGRFFKIEEIYFFDYEKYGCKIQNMYFDTTYVKITDRTKNGFIGEIFVRPLYNAPFSLANINPVNVEFCGGISSGQLEFYMDNDRDGLLLDRYHHGILNTLDDSTVPDIYIYKLNVNGVEHL